MASSPKPYTEKHIQALEEQLEKQVIPTLDVSLARAAIALERIADALEPKTSSEEVVIFVGKKTVTCPKCGADHLKHGGQFLVCPNCGFSPIPYPEGWRKALEGTVDWSKLLKGRISRCPACGSEEVTRFSSPSGTSALCRDCRHDWRENDA